MGPRPFRSTAPTSQTRSSSPPSTNSWPPCRGRARTAWPSSRIATRTRTCCTRRRACMIFCAPTSTSRAPIGRKTIRIASRRGRPSSLRPCRPITSWIARSAWPQPSPPTCPCKRRSQRTAGCPRTNWPSTRKPTRGPAFKVASIGFAAIRIGRQIRDRALRWPDNRRAVLFHLWSRRLGHLPQARRPRAHADEHLHQDGRRSPHRRRGPLGAAGATGSLQHGLGGFPAQEDLDALKAVVSPTAFSAWVPID